MVAVSQYSGGREPASPIGRRRFGNYWETYSLKAGRNVRLYSDLEYIFWILLESDPQFVRLREQPLRIRVKMANGRWVTSILDFWALGRSGEEYFFEVKYARDIERAGERDRITRQLRAQLVWAMQNRYHYAIATERTLWPLRLYAANWTLILRFLYGQQFTLHFSELCERVTRCLLIRGELSLATIESEFSSEHSDTVKRALFWNLKEGRVGADLVDQKLGRRTLFRYAHR